MGKQRRLLPSEQSITVPPLTICCSGAKMGLKTAFRESTFICCWVLSVRADSPINFGGIGGNARSRIGILTGLFLVRERIFPIIMYTGHAFLSPQKLVRCVWSDNPIICTNVDPTGRVSSKGAGWTISIGHTDYSEFFPDEFRT